ncbi:unnamed protein product [Camellia sinensis]
MASLHKRGAAMGLHHMDDRLIDGLKVLNNIFIIGTTNRKELIDEALLRIELHVKVEYPDEQGRLQILGIYTRNMIHNFVLDKDVNLHEIACRTDGCSGSTLASLVTRAHSYVVVHTRENGFLQHVENDFKVTMNHFLCAIEDVKSRLQESDLEPSRMGKEEMETLCWWRSRPMGLCNPNRCCNLKVETPDGGTWKTKITMNNTSR